MTIYFQHSWQRGFGTFPLVDNVVAEAVTQALAIGYRAFDTAQMYGNEAEVGAALANFDDALCITTKVHPDNFDSARFIPSVERSLELLQLDAVDVLLLHWPPADGNITPSLRLLEQAYKQGLAHNIGVSNYTARMMRDATDIISTPLVTNQVEFHPLLNQDILLQASQETGIPLSSYCSLARGRVFDFPELTEIGNHYGKNAAQVALRWIIQKGVSINTMSTNPDNMASNFAITDFELTDAQMAQIDTLTATDYRIVNKSIVPWAPDFD